MQRRMFAIMTATDRLNTNRNEAVNGRVFLSRVDGRSLIRSPLRLLPLPLPPI